MHASCVSVTDGREENQTLDCCGSDTLFQWKTKILTVNSTKHILVIESFSFYFFIFLIPVIMSNSSSLMLEDTWNCSPSHPVKGRNERASL